MRKGNHYDHEQACEGFEEVLDAPCHHEAAHAVFAYYAGVGIADVRVSEERCECAIYRADLYERYQPWEYALFSIAGAYAAGVRGELEHPTIEEMPLSWLLEEARRGREGDAWCAIETLKEDVAATEDSRFGSLQEAYSALFGDLGRLVEKRWDDIEAVAFALERGYWESGKEGLGRLDDGDVARIIQSIHKESSHA